MKVTQNHYFCTPPPTLLIHFGNQRSSIQTLYGNPIYGQPFLFLSHKLVLNWSLTRLDMQ